jgi:hypothetical protein
MKQLYPVQSTTSGDSHEIVHFALGALLHPDPGILRHLFRRLATGDCDATTSL